MKKILFVEDDALITRIYSQKLLEAGFEVATAEDGLEAIKRLPVFRPDLVVLDILMPKLTGADVLKFMRQHPDLRTIRVIVLSNAFLSNLVQQISAMGVEAALVKAAVTPKLLVQAINETLEKPEHEPGPTTTMEAFAADSGTIGPEHSAKAGSSRVLPEAEPAARREQDSEFEERVGRQFLALAPAVFKELRHLCRDFLDAAKSPREPERLLALDRKLGFLTQMTGMAGCQQTAELSSALEALLFELIHEPGTLTDSARQTVAFTIVFLADRFDRGELMTEKIRPPATILVVDDDAVSNLAVVQSLSRAKLLAVSVTDPLEALRMLKEKPYDAVLLDVAMPKIDGLVLCEQMRDLPLHKRTPVVFVTGLTDFKTYARSILSGGNDLIAKPISPNELCVKVITHLLRRV